jgi:hypothetical protein
MVNFTDFPNGLQNASEYLNANNSLNASLSGSVADVGRFMIQGKLDLSPKEIICSLLAGRGLKLPNLQICISLNLSALTDILNGLIGQVQGILTSALASLENTFNKFMNHLKLDAVLGRINGLIGEITNIASMINFCSAPINPVQIPDVLGNAMGSFLGKGKSIIDSIGTIPDLSIGGCLIGGNTNVNGVPTFNPIDSFTGGILGILNANFEGMITGTLSDPVINSIINDINTVNNEIETLIDEENGVRTNYSQGGSDLTEDDARDTNTGMGVLYNSQDEGIRGATQNANQLYALYQQAGSYQVVDTDGTVYNNIFETFVEEDLMRILRRTPNPTPEITQRIPIYNYCNELIGYTTEVLQEETDLSIGLVPLTISQPGFDAGGLPTNPNAAAQAIVSAFSDGDGSTVTNNITNVYSTTGTDTANLNGAATSTSASAIEILFDGSRLAPATNTLWFATVTAVANRSDADNATAIKIQGLVNNNGGTVSISGTVGNKTIFNGTNATSNYDLLLDVVNNELRVRVQGDTGHNVDWAVKMDFIESP